MDRSLYFSIVVPAHNEEAYIAATLERLRDLDYPKDRYEVIVVENGSTDATFQVASQHASLNVRILTCPEKGVSKARNHGSRLVNPAADWVFFLDADILIDPPILQKLSALILEATDKGVPYVAGTAALRPFPPTLSMRIMYAVANFTFSLTGATYAGALLIKKEYLTKVSFDELLQVGEDESIAKELRREGKLFFFRSGLIHSSTRRFQNGGAKKIPIWVGMWLFAMIAPYHVRITTALQRRFKYKVAR